MGSAPEPASDLIEELVHQFTDPFAFYRELIQNSIDAGSTRIEVALRYQPSGKRGLLTAQVADWGEGMNRRTIEDYLVTKFRSTKEGDLTKIGKFGIGFLSVFAPAPDLVVVETGRDGEDWRLLFHPDRTYELLRSPEPVEGTRVTLHKEVGVAEYREFAARSEAAVRRWCRHSEAEVAFAAGGADGSAPGPPAPVREPLLADAPFQVESRDEHTRIVAGPARTEPPLGGFYNRGLTLLEARAEHFPDVPGVSFKIVSNLLEHTLTRDNVRRDRSFDRLARRLRELVEGPLRDRLPAELRAAAEREEPGSDYESILAYARRVLPTDQLWFPAAGRGAVDGRALAGAVGTHGGIVHGPAGTPLVQALQRKGVPVLDPRVVESDTVRQALAAATEGAAFRPAADSFALAQASPYDDATRALCRALIPLLAACGARTTQVVVGDVEGAGGHGLCVLAHEAGVAEVADRALTAPFAEGAPPVLCLNRAHPPVTAAVALAARSPRLAAVLLARLVAVASGALDEEADRRLVEAALS